MILLDPRDPRPIYEQIVERMSGLLAAGALQPGEPLPSVRSLAAELSVNPNTVQRAYLELERRGFICTVKGKGSFVADAERIQQERTETLLKELDRLVERAAASRVPEKLVTERVRAGYAAASGIQTAESGGNPDD